MVASSTWRRRQHQQQQRRWPPGTLIFLILAMMLVLAGILQRLSRNGASSEVEDKQQIITIIPVTNAIGSTDVRQQQQPQKKFLLTCSRTQTSADEYLITQFKNLFTSSPTARSHIYVTLSTLSSWPATLLHLSSLVENAPQTRSHFITICVGNETFVKCQQTFPTTTILGCVQDTFLNSRIDTSHAAHSLSSGDGNIDISYVEIIWRKPELIRLLFEAGAMAVTFVDSDGVWFKDPSPTSHPTPMSSAEFVTPGSSYPLTPNDCISAPRFRDTPLILNSGTVYLKNDDLGNEILTLWMSWRARSNGACTISPSMTLARDTVSLDQDGLNMAVCNLTISRQTTTIMTVYSSNDVLLNSVHQQARALPASQFGGICRPFFFHATNCGTDKSICMKKNLARRREANCAAAAL